MALTLKTAPARQGAVWVRQGLVECLRHPLRYLSLFGCFMLVGAFVSALPWVGEVLLVMGIPLLSLAYMMATLASVRGQPPTPLVFLAPWQQLSSPLRRQLLLLCMSYAFATLLGLALCSLIDHGALQLYVDTLGAGNADPATLEKLGQAPGIGAGALSRVLVLTLIGTPFWHAPGLVVWGEQSVAQALFSSTLAMWRNKAAFVVYLLSYVALALLFSLVATPLMVLLGLGPLIAWILMPLALLLTTSYYVSLFFTFRDSFASDATASDKDGLSAP